MRVELRSIRGGTGQSMNLTFMLSSGGLYSYTLFCCSFSFCSLSGGGFFFTGGIWPLPLKFSHGDTVSKSGLRAESICRNCAICCPRFWVIKAIVSS